VSLVVGLTELVLTDLALTDLALTAPRLQVITVDRTIRVATPLSRHMASNRSDSLLNISTVLRDPLILLSRDTAAPRLRILRSRNTVLRHRSNTVRLPSTVAAILPRLANRTTLLLRVSSQATVPPLITPQAPDTKARDMVRRLLQADIRVPPDTEVLQPIRAAHRRCNINRRRVRTRTHRRTSSSTVLFVYFADLGLVNMLGLFPIFCSKPDVCSSA